MKHEDDALTVNQLMNRLVQARLPDSVTADNPSRFPKLFVDNLIVEQNRTEQDLKESIERWFGIEDEPEVQLAELENALQESTQAEQEVAEIGPSSDEDQEPITSKQVSSNLTMDEAKQSIIDICRFAASIECHEAQDHLTTALNCLQKYAKKEESQRLSNTRQLTLHDVFKK